MIHITLPLFDSDFLLDSIIANKKQVQRDTLIPHKDRVKERYRYYEEHKNSLEEIRSLGTVWDSIKDVLLSCYGTNKAFTEAKKSLIAAMPSIVQNKCPYCMLNRPNTLDHYFDKNDFPEYVVYIPNLLPCCSECNILKGNTVFDSDGNRKYIHFYYDHIPDYQFLFIRFINTAEDIVPRIEVSLRFQTGELQELLIKSHFSGLKLLDKYKSAINEKLAVILKEIHSSVNRGLADSIIRDILEIRYHAIVELCGINYWEACIFEGILNSPEFLNNCFATIM